MNKIANAERRIGIGVVLMAYSFVMYAAGAFASPAIYSISDTAEIKWPAQLSYTTTALLSFDTVIFDVSSSNLGFKPSKITVIRHKPALWASTQAVKNSWLKNIKNVAKISKAHSWRDQGCKQTGPGRFSCLRTGKTENGETVVENMLWNRNQDEVLIRTVNQDTPENALKLAQSVVLNFKEGKR